MTPAQLEHLRRIDAHLERLLAIAEKRTSGEWLDRTSSSFGKVVEHFVMRSEDDVAICSECRDPIIDKPSADNAAFIASCAGNAEAGWRATRVFIAFLIYLELNLNDTNPETMAVLLDARCKAQDILAAFPNI